MLHVPDDVDGPLPDDVLDLRGTSSPASSAVLWTAGPALHGPAGTVAQGLHDRDGARRAWEHRGETEEGRVVSVPLLSKLDDWTVEDLVALPDDGRRYEIVDGSLVVSPAPGIRHEVVVEAVRQVLRQAVPPGLRLLGSVNVAFGRHVRVPDVVVVREDLVGRDVLAASPEDVVLAVEVVSPSSVTTDRVTKPAQYAAAGIDHFWRVEPSEGPLLAVHERVGDRYVERGTWAGDQEAVLARPFPVRVVPADLAR